MLEVVFSDSAAGSLAAAQSRGRRLGGAVGVIITRKDGEEPAKREPEVVRREVLERERRDREQAVFLESSRRDICSFPLALSMGEIRQGGIGPQREAALNRLMEVYPDVGRDAAGELLAEASESLERLLTRAAQGEPVRVWASRQPDDACGLYWLMEQLRPIGFENFSVWLVGLPDFEEQGDGTVVQHTGWGEVEPWEWGRCAREGKPLPANLAQAMACRWQYLQKENAPLRAMLNGQLMSVPETLYDSFIWRELGEEAGDFLEARVVGRVLGRYQLGISDGWVALRIEQFIREGLLEAVTQPKAGGPVYHRLLRRAGPQ